MKYRKKQIVIEAIQFLDNEERISQLGKFIGEKVLVSYSENIIPIFKIKTLEGIMKAREGDYIIKGINGEFYPCKSDIFKKTYDIIIRR